jgi:hypothetical protein
MHLMHVRTCQYFIKPAEAHREMRMLQWVDVAIEPILLPIVRVGERRITLS